MPAISAIKLRRGTAAAWASANPTLAAGEEGIETDTGLRKVGNGSTAWNSLAYNVAVPTGTYVTVQPTRVDASQYATLALAAAALPASGACKLVLSQPLYMLDQRIVLTNGQCVEGVGGDITLSSSNVIQCTTAGAGLTFEGSGGISKDFTLWGNSIANNPMKVTLGAHRTFINVGVVAALQDNWIIEEHQNGVFLGCGSNIPGRDGLVLDKETGGLLFERFESNQAGRYALRVLQSRVSPGGYLRPTHITLDHSIFERGSASSTVSLENCEIIRFVSCVMQSDGNLPTANILGGSAAIFDSCTWLAPVAQAKAIAIASGTGATLLGQNSFVGSAAAVDLPTGASLTVSGTVLLGTGTAWVTAATPQSGDVGASLPTRVSISSTRPASDGIVMSSQVVGEAGQRWRMFANGTFLIGDGTNYVFDAGMERNSVGALVLHSKAGQPVYTIPPLVSLDDIECLTIGDGFIAKSPDGTRYRITIANGGALSAVAVSP